MLYLFMEFFLFGFVDTAPDAHEPGGTEKFFFLRVVSPRTILETSHPYSPF